MMTDKGLKRLSFLLGLLFLTCGELVFAQSCPDFANNAGYILASATGSGSGTDWTNACTGFTGSCAGSAMVRGCTYYIGAGTYTPSGGTLILNKPDSGTSTITIQSPTTSDHGTSSGWSNSFVGQAQINAGVEMDTDYWVINGAYRSTANGNPWTDWRADSAYGIFINDKKGPCTAGNPNVYNASAIVAFGNADACGNGCASNHSTLEYATLQGSGCTQTAVGAEFGIWLSGIRGTPSTGTHISHVHLSGATGNEIAADGNNNSTIEYSWFEKMNSYSTNGSETHSETISYRGNGTTGNDTNVFRWNFVECSGGTAMLATPNAAGTLNNLQVYGNVFFDNPSEENNPMPGGALISIGYGYTTISNIYIVNNTFANIALACGAQCPNGPGPVVIGSDTNSGNLVAYNNIWYGQTQPYTSGGNFKFDYSGLYKDSAGMCSNALDTHKLCSSTNPFVNVAYGTLDADNFNLTANTALNGLNTHSILPGNDVDMNGTVRGSGNWDVGALQFQGSTPPPAAPTGLAALVQ